MIENLGELEITDADDANIPVNCFFSKDDDKYTWTADNFMPRKSRASEGTYHLKANTKKEILEKVKEHVVPLYENALHNMKTIGENYYWSK